MSLHAQSLMSAWLHAPCVVCCLVHHQPVLCRAVPHWSSSSPLLSFSAPIPFLPPPSCPDEQASSGRRPQTVSQPASGDRSALSSAPQPSPLPRDWRCQRSSRTCANGGSRWITSHAMMLPMTCLPSLRAPAALASTGSARRDRATLEQFTRLCARVPLLQSNQPARTQLTQIVFGSLAQLRAQEDRAAELCDASLSSEGCSLCSWKQKPFCEKCGTDFSKTKSRCGYPLFIPMYDAGRLHIDVCMLCSETCIEQMLAAKEAMQADKERARKQGGNGAAPDTSSVRRSRSATDPHHSTGSLLFHACAYGALLCALLLADVSVATLIASPLGWQLLATLLLHGLWLLNLMLTCTARGEVSSVYRLRQALSIVCSVATVTCVTALALLAAAAVAQPSTGIFDVPASDLLLLAMLVLMPVALCTIDLLALPHVRMPRWLERGACMLLPSLMFAFCLHARGSASQLTDGAAAATHSPAAGALATLPDPLFGLSSSSSALASSLGVYVALVLGLIAAVTLTVQAVRDRVWQHYIVPKHLQSQ